MEQIKIVFFALASFFGIEDGRIAADKTTVTISPEENKIEIIQQDLFTIIQSEEDSTQVVAQWNNIYFWKERNTSWSKHLDSFPVKNFNHSVIENTINPHLMLTYSKEENLCVFGIWYDAKKNQFFINHVPKNNLKTNDGMLEGNYWVFNGDSTFSFTIEPFKDMPEVYQNFKKTIMELLPKVKKK